MSNKTQLQTNNEKLNELNSLATLISSKVDSLPDAGSGGTETVEMCTITLSLEAPPFESFTAYYIDQNNNLQIVDIGTPSGKSTTFSVIKDRIFIITPWAAMMDPVGDSNIETLLQKTAGGIFLPHNDGTIEFWG